MSGVRCKVRDAAHSMAPIIKRALEEWLDAADELQGHAQYACTEATRRLVKAALQDAPWPSWPDKSKDTPWRRQAHRATHKASWLEKHLPGISTAMQECVVRQIDITTKRISILNSLLGSAQQANNTQHGDNTQLTKRLEAEQAAYICVEVHFCVLDLLLPVAGLCTCLTLLSKPAKGGMHNQQGHGHQHATQQGSGLSLLGQHIKYALHARAKVHGQMYTLQQSVEHMHIPMTRRLQCVLGPRGCFIWLALIWLRLAVQLPPDTSGAVLVLSFIDWERVGRESELDPALWETVKTEFCRLFSDPDFRSQLQSVFSRIDVAKMLLGVGLYPEDLRDVGVPVAEMWALYGKEEPTASEAEASAIRYATQYLLGSCTENDTGGDMALSGCCSTDGSQWLENDDAGIAADDKPECGVVVVDDDDGLGDMHALVRLMYGSESSRA